MQNAVTLNGHCQAASEDSSRILGVVDRAEHPVTHWTYGSRSYERLGDNFSREHVRGVSGRGLAGVLERLL